MRNGFKFVVPCVDVCVSVNGIRKRDGRGNEHKKEHTIISKI